MAGGGKSRATSAVCEIDCGHGEVEGVRRESIVHELVKMPQQIARARLEFKLMQCFRIYPVGHQRRAYAMTRHVANEDRQRLVTMWKDHAKVTAYSVSWSEVSLDRNVIPN